MADKEKAVDESLDFLSSNFDPVKALTTSPSKIQVPCPDVQPCDNLRIYEAVLSGRRRLPVPPKEEESAGPPPLVSAPAPARPQEPRFYAKSVVAFMKRESLGPFKLLQDCWRSQCRVRVWTRHCVGVRGVCEGVSLAFDKHMNLVLEDVTEYYKPFRTLRNGGLDSTRSKERKRKKKKAKAKEKLDSDSMIKASEPVVESSDHAGTSDDHVTQNDCHVTKPDDYMAKTTACTGKTGGNDCHVTEAGDHVTETNVCTTKAGDHVTQSCSHMLKHLDTFQTRHLLRLFIRGDNVVLISPIR